ncbi:heavy-metal-associated domain-containing protein [Psychroserpens luteolus]|uniref:heavy-metal-associated domain-containing protein n=1 Tax=Psychroserpens luteolus TaxID=2855840 RepID=UPI001E322353|nr:heavy-metal-associated domain-containing protein [Psychroserpens luteolus]MCD2260386.1 heavy-metal-associated domain-containing protein [Psychroserpens luteolus]
METILHIQNLKCGGCAHTIITRLESLEGINNVTVNNESHAVHFNYSSDKQLETATSLLSTLGYPVEGEANPLTKKAKSFVSCAVGRINK